MSHWPRNRLFPALRTTYNEYEQEGQPLNANQVAKLDILVDSSILAPTQAALISPSVTHFSWKDRTDIMDLLGKKPPTTDVRNLTEGEKFIRMQRDGFAAQVKNLDQALDLIQKTLHWANTGPIGAVSNPNSLPPVIPGEYKGKKTGKALDVYLAERKGHKIPIAKVEEDLLLAGTNMGKRDPMWNLNIAISTKKNIGHDPEAGTIWLVTASESTEDRPRKKR